VIASSAQTFTTVAYFTGPTGFGPVSGVVQGVDGNFYGAAPDGVNGDYGEVYRVTPGGTLSPIFNFSSDCADGCYPSGALVLATDGYFYGTTTGGGDASMGNVYRISRKGGERSIYSFCVTNCADGSNPMSALVQAGGGDLYGTTYSGGSQSGGTVFKITAGGTLTTLYSFCSLAGCTDGEFPGSELIYAGDGNLYGTTGGGGANVGQSCPLGCGTVFEITPTGTLTTLHSFNGSDGAFPLGPVIEGADGELYGLTAWGGNGNCPYGCGTVFKVSREGKLTPLHSFSGGDGSEPASGLALATDGNFYGVTSGISTGGPGTIFRITPAGEFRTLYNFCSSCGDGYNPITSLLQATNGTFYGTTNHSGANGNGDGTIFSLSVGLKPFVKILPTLGAVGTSVVILGNGLTGTSGVSFNGTTAVFTVVSDTEITATVPVGATTGKVAVTTLGGILKSNVAFRVTK
jgi:uncharacterized repeat protein (TIGR03803 family)